MTQPYIDGMLARSHGRTKDSNPHSRIGSEPQDYEDWTNGWNCVNTHVEMMIANAQAMKSQIIESRRQNTRRQSYV